MNTAASGNNAAPIQSLSPPSWPQSWTAARWRRQLRPWPRQRPGGRARQQHRSAAELAPRPKTDLQDVLRPQLAATVASVALLAKAINGFSKKRLRLLAAKSATLAALERLEKARRLHRASRKLPAGQRHRLAVTRHRQNSGGPTNRKFCYFSIESNLFSLNQFAP